MKRQIQLGGVPLLLLEVSYELNVKMVRDPNYQQFVKSQVPPGLSQPKIKNHKLILVISFRENYHIKIIKKQDYAETFLTTY